MRFMRCLTGNMSAICVRNNNVNNEVFNTGPSFPSKVSNKCLAIILAARKETGIRHYEGKMDS
jgi:hypothetical protein